MNIEKIIKEALLEDIPTIEVTTDAIFSNEVGSSYIIAKENGVLSGIDTAIHVFNSFPNIVLVKHFNNGDEISKGDIVLEIKGLVKNILKAERLALNIMQRMSGIATTTRKYVDEIKLTNAKLLDTRKTTPNLRVLEKLAVLHGGGTNHRMNLSDMAMIKDNHIQAAGSMAKAVDLVRKNSPEVEVEIEVASVQEFEIAKHLNVDVIMLDNMSNGDMKRCVENNNSKLLEASGNVELATIKKIAETGVDYISVGALTHSYKSLDLSLKFN